LREYRVNRCIHEVAYNILKHIATEGPENITSICRAANLPADRGIRIVNALIKFGLLTSYIAFNNKPRKFYILTERGYEYIGIYEHLKELFNPFNIA